jgi:hypothetical protein
MVRAGTRHDLSQVKQEMNETLRSYTRCFFKTRATIANITDEDAIRCFQNGLFSKNRFFLAVGVGRGLRLELLLNGIPILPYPDLMRDLHLLLHPPLGLLGYLLLPSSGSLYLGGLLGRTFCPVREVGARLGMTEPLEKQAKVRRRSGTRGPARRRREEDLPNSAGASYRRPSGP